MKAYIAGPMTGYSGYNIAAFDKAESRLIGLGYSVVNPAHVLEYSPDHSWSDYLRADIRELMLCDTVFALPGWECSRGARIEVELAISIGITVLPYATTETA